MLFLKKPLCLGNLSPMPKIFIERAALGTPDHTHRRYDADDKVDNIKTQLQEKNKPRLANLQFAKENFSYNKVETNI